MTANKTEYMTLCNCVVVMNDKASRLTKHLSTGVLVAIFIVPMFELFVLSVLLCLDLTIS